MDTLLIAPIFNFALVAFILIYFGKKPFADMLAARSSGLATFIQGAEAEAKEANAQLAQWESKWNGAAAEAKQAQADAEIRTEAFRAATLVSGKQQAERIVHEAGAVGQAEATKGRDTLEKEIVRKSIAMANDFLGAHVGEKDRHQLVAEYVELVNDGSAR